MYMKFIANFLILFFFRILYIYKPNKKQVNVIENMCFADLFETDLRDGQEKIVKSTFDFSYRSFSFQKSAKDRQSIQDEPQIAIKIS